MKLAHATLTLLITGCMLSPGNLSTGLSGVVLRGPVTPVCQVNVPCDAPFSATFTIQQGSAVLAKFQSDAQGRFEVRLPPGTYQVVPDADAPILSPSSQAKQVQVGADTMTVVQLDFDTGIR